MHPHRRHHNPRRDENGKNVQKRGVRETIACALSASAGKFEGISPATHAAEIGLQLTTLITFKSPALSTATLEFDGVAAALLVLPVIAGSHLYVFSTPRLAAQQTQSVIGPHTLCRWAREV
jgi:hypothetical protein